MAAKVLVFAKKPKSAEAFDKYYASTHIPLAKKNSRPEEVRHRAGGVGTPAGPSEIHLVATLQFDSLSKPFYRAGM